MNRKKTGWRLEWRKGGRKPKMDAKKAVIGGMAAAAAIALVLSMVWLTGDASPAVLVKINGEPVVREEFLYYAQKIEREVRDGLCKEAGKEAEQFRWSDEINGKTGYDWLAQRTVEAMTPWKIIQIETEKLGLAEGTDYESIMKRKEAENKERRKTKEKGGVLYGVVEYSESEYYDYFNSNLQTRYQERLIKDGVLTVTEAEMKAVYEEQISYFNGESYETVKNSVRIAALEEKYQEYLAELAGNSKVQIVDEEAFMDAVKEALGEM